jgi:4-amino-4-deoxy-L-arabinose transferase-like glycosyltransferase
MKTRLLVALLLLGGAAVLLLTTALRTPFAWALDVGTPPDSRFLANFFPPEQGGDTTFRWSGPGSRLLLPAASHHPLRLTLRLNGDMLQQHSDGRLHLQREQHDIAFVVAPGWHRYHVLLPAAGGRGAPPPVALVSALHSAGPADGRSLGVPLDWLAVATLEHSHQSALPAAAVLLLALPAAVLLVVQGATRARLAHHATRAMPHAARLAQPAVLLLAAHVLLFAPLPVAWRGVGAVLLLALPGILLVRLLFGSDALSHLERLFLALCGAIAGAALLLLALQVVPGALHRWLLLLVCDTLSIALIVHHRKQNKGTPPDSRSTLPASISPLQPPPVSLLLFPFALICGVVLRLLFLGSAEFQGDEGLALLAAAGVLHGRDDVLLLRPKGPVEALLPAGVMVLSGHINEWVARLPFALAGIGVLVGVFLLAQRMATHTENERHFALCPLPFALLTLTILALDGFLIAYSRIVQYQSIVVLMGTGALWCCWRFYSGVPAPLRHLLSAAVLAGVGMLAHYDGIFVLPAMAWLVLAGGWRRGWQWRQWLAGVGAPALVGAVLLLSFYLPLVMHEHFTTHTMRYLEWRVGQQAGSSTLFNNLPGYYAQATFYNTTFQVHALALVLLAALLWWMLRYVKPCIVGGLLALVLLVGVVLLVAAPHRFVVGLAGGQQNLAILYFALPLAVLAGSPATPPALRMALIWFAVPFTAMSFVIEVPNTHYYTMDAAAALLIAWALVQGWQWLAARRQRWAQRALLLVGVCLLLLTLPYLAVLYVRQEPEYQRSFPAARAPLYRAGYGDSLPTGGYFGFPHRDGWKVIGELYRRGELEGSYSSNQKERLTAWYTRGAPRCSDNPDYYFLARGQSYVVPEGYALQGYVLVGNRRAMDIYGQEGVAVPQGYTLAELAGAFDARAIPDFPLESGLTGAQADGCE